MTAAKGLHAAQAGRRGVQHGEKAAAGWCALRSVPDPSEHARSVNVVNGKMRCARGGEGWASL